jgi:acyl-coenzyme A synthetase/AMP-(fatty) acid ligase
MSLTISQFQDRIAFMKGDIAADFASVNTLTQVALGALALKGLPRGAPVGVIGNHGPAVSAWLLACAQAGCTAVPLSGNPAEHEARLKMVGASLVVRCGFDDWTLEEGPGGRMPPLLADLAKRGRAGLVLFSSGTSGEPKAMVQDLTSLLESYADRKPSRLPICILLSFDHIGGLNTLLGALASGAPIVVPESRSPSDVAAAIEQHKAAVLPATPTFLNLLLASGEHQRRDLSSLRLITYGTEPMPPPLLERLRAAFPRAKFVQTFGTSETGIGRTESPDPGSLFMKMEGQEWKVVDGELWLRSKTSILGYLNAPNDRFTPDGWFRTGDQVELGPDNTFRVLGRAGEMINVGGEKLLPQEVEAIILEVPGVLDCRVRGEPSALTGQTVVAEIVPSSGSDPESLRSAVRSACRAILDRHKVPTKVSFVESVSGGRVKKVRG